MTTVLLLDDHAVLRDALRRLIDGEPDLKVVGDAATGAEALRIAEREHPEVALVDLRLGAESALPVIRGLRALQNPPRVVVLTMHADRDSAIEALSAGAEGYVLKASPAEDVLRALRAAASGGACLDPQVAARLLACVTAGATVPERELTPREREVLELVRSGLRNREIACRLHLSEKTVKHHVGQVLQKTGAQSRRALRPRA